MKRLFYNGNISGGDAVVAEDGKIIFIGSQRDAFDLCEGGARVTNLCGCTLIPAFIDAHSHLSSCAAQLLYAPLGECTSIDDILNALSEFLKSHTIPNGKWLIGSGYDTETLSERTSPTADILDKAFPDIPTMIIHKSSHCGVINTAAAHILGINPPNGLLEEAEFAKACEAMPMPSEEDIVSAFEKAQEMYAACGIVTVQEGMMPARILDIYAPVLQKNALFLDVVGYAAANDADEMYSRLSEYVSDYKSNFRLDGVKVILDGSPQLKTAWLNEPYTDGTDGYKPYMSDDTLFKIISDALSKNRRVLAHCNGDGAAEQFVRVLKKAHNIAPHIRNVMIHAQLLPKALMRDVKSLGIIPSFFNAHVYEWGDVHIRNLGFERASRISPAKSALDEDIIFTLHRDCPVLNQDIIGSIESAVKRRTKSGILLGGDERISPLEALRAVTVNAAYQYGEEDVKGSIAVGKYADFAVLSSDPLEIGTGAVPCVVETVRRGETVYMSPSAVHGDV